MTDVETAPDEEVAEDEDVGENEESDSQQAEESCSILALDLGPLDLDLLGLRIQLDEIDLDITAERGPRNLLGNLLCAISRLLGQLRIPDALQELLQRLWDFVRNLLQRIGIGQQDEEDEEEEEEEAA